MLFHVHNNLIISQIYEFLSVFPCMYDYSLFSKKSYNSYFYSCKKSLTLHIAVAEYGKIIYLINY